LEYDRYKDKVLAGWIGKSIGGVIGARLENHKELKALQIDELWPNELLPNDDLDLQVVWLEALQERGLFLTSDDLADFWRDRCWYSFCEYGVFLNNVQRGIAPPLSGVWNNGFFKDSEGCPIRAEIWGYVTPGNPALAAEYARLDGQLDHGEISIQAEQFLAAAACQSLLTDDLESALAVGLSVLSQDSTIARAVPRVREIAEQYPDPRQAWRLTIREFGDRDASKAITNHALTLLALFLGEGDLKKTMQLCAGFGWDTDCTASTAGALLGALGGTAELPADWVEKLGKTLICGINVKHQNASLESFAEDTCRIGVEMSRARNEAIEITGAPPVEVRPMLSPAITINVEYGSVPVLWNQRPTEVRLKICNPFKSEHSGRLDVDVPHGISCEMGSTLLDLPAQGQNEILLTIRRTQPGGFIADKNLFCARWMENETEIAERVFGLGGARQWQVYGPYWDMWDKTKNAICPYRNEEFTGGPFTRGLMGDCYNQYAFLDHNYLDENRLLREDIPAEVPLLIEMGEDRLSAADLGGFRGQACYYLVRTIRSAVPDVESHMTLGRTGPYRAWLDGVEIGQSREMRGWAMMDDTSLKVQLTGRPQRLVIKLIRLTDAFDFSLYFAGPGDKEHKRGTSNILDCLEDFAPLN
jgi:ADP-ribosylglycohydrolase